MLTSYQDIVSITKARGNLGNLAEKAAGNRIIVLTKGGNPKVALVDVRYLTKLQDSLRKIYRRTFIDSAVFPYTREFSDKEIKKWEEEDRL